MKKRNSSQTNTSEAVAKTDAVNDFSDDKQNESAIEKEEIETAVNGSDLAISDLASDKASDANNDTDPGIPRGGPRTGGCPYGRGRNCRLPTSASCPRQRNRSVYCRFEYGG